MLLPLPGSGNAGRHAEHAKSSASIMSVTVGEVHRLGGRIT